MFRLWCFDLVCVYCCCLCMVGVVWCGGSCFTWFVVFCVALFGGLLCCCVLRVVWCVVIVLCCVGGGVLIWCVVCCVC